MKFHSTATHNLDEPFQAIPSEIHPVPHIQVNLEHTIVYPDAGYTETSTIRSSA